MLAKKCGHTKVCQKRWQSNVNTQIAVRNAAKHLCLHNESTKPLEELITTQCNI